MNPKVQKLLIIGILALGVGIMVPALALNTLVDNTAVDTTTVNTVNEVASGNVTTHNLNVTGTCTGCGGGGDGSYTHWSIFSNTEFTNDNLYNFTSSEIKVGNNGFISIYNGLTNSEGNQVQLFFPNGTQYDNEVVDATANTLHSQTFDESDGGIYEVIEVKENISGQIYHVFIFKPSTVPIVGNNQIININSTYFGNLKTSVGISPDGQWVVIYGQDTTGGDDTRLQVWKGS